MTKPLSKIAENRRTGKNQVDELRSHILDSAEKCFLENGIENTRMGDIASLLDISRVTLYRYFANRDEIAVEIQVRMLEKINAVLPREEHQPTLDSYRKGIQAIMSNYASLRDAYRFTGMFDRIYLDHAPDSTLAQWTKAQLMASTLGQRAARGEFSQQQPYGDQLDVILSAFTWFLQKLALRDELTWSNPDVPIETHLDFFERIILQSFDLVEKE